MSYWVYVTLSCHNWKRNDIHYSGAYLFTSFVYCTNVYWSVIHGIKRKPHLSVVWNWYHFVAIAILHQPRPTDSADINTRLQLSDTSSIPPMHGGFLLAPHYLLWNSTSFTNSVAWLITEHHMVQVNLPTCGKIYVISILGHLLPWNWCQDHCISHLEQWFICAELISQVDPHNDIFQLYFSVARNKEHFKNTFCWPLISHTFWSSQLTLK